MRTKSPSEFFLHAVEFGIEGLESLAPGGFFCELALSWKLVQVQNGTEQLFRVSPGRSRGHVFEDFLQTIVDGSGLALGRGHRRGPRASSWPRELLKKGVIVIMGSMVINAGKEDEFVAEIDE